MGLYCGRFAPSPTGPLHLGSLIAAVASFLDARSNKGLWLVRMDDLDPPREEPGAAQDILRSLQIHGLQWDKPVVWQSQRHRAYQAALSQLDLAGIVFPCDCTRARLSTLTAYDGHCRHRTQVHPPHALRVRVHSGSDIAFFDRIQGSCSSHLDRESGDFVIKRKDQLYAYQLAVAVDDAFQGISHIVRGADLLDSTARQIYLMQQLGFTTPSYAHIPVITDDNGHKLSKQTHAPALLESDASSNLRYALAFLGQPLAPSSARNPEQILNFARDVWSLSSIPKVREHCGQFAAKHHQ